MLDKLNIVKQRFDEVSDLIIQPDIIADQKRYVTLNKEYKDLKIICDKREEYITLTDNLKEAEEIIADGSDAEMVEMAKMQYDEAKESLPKLEEEIAEFTQGEKVPILTFGSVTFDKQRRVMTRFMKRAAYRRLVASRFLHRRRRASLVPYPSDRRRGACADRKRG